MVTNNSQCISVYVREVQHDAFSFIVLRQPQIYVVSAVKQRLQPIQVQRQVAWYIGLSCPSYQDIHSNPMFQSFPVDFHVGLFLLHACFPSSCS